MRNVLTVIALISLFACKEERQQEIISLDELTGETGSQEFIDTTQINILDSAPSLINDFVNSQTSIYDTIGHQTPHSIDRFGFGTKQKLEFRSKKTFIDSKLNHITAVARLYYYTFSDTTKTINAFYNWLDCFGPDCDVLKLNEDLAKLSTPPIFTLVYDTCIVAIEYVCGQEKNDWKSFQDSIISKFGKDYKYRIDSKCGGPLKWKQPIKH